MPTATPALELGADAIAMPAAAKAININFFIIRLPPQLIIELLIRRKVAPDYSPAAIGGYFGYPVTQKSGPTFLNPIRSKRALLEVDRAPSAPNAGTPPPVKMGAT